jgi:hypothetical protein
MISQLSATDRKVRAHEMAHLAAAGSYAKGGPSYSYQTGPDGKLYAVGGEVAIDTSPDPTDPRRTIEKARTIEAAANAPADPSPQDRQVAAAAEQMAMQAAMQIAAQQMKVVHPQSGGDGNGAGTAAAAAYQQSDVPELGQLMNVTG